MVESVATLQEGSLRIREDQRERERGRERGGEREREREG
jgi:hypothetical protein